MQRRFRSFISALAVFCYAVVGVGAVHADMLCLGADGHLALAGPAGDDRCHDESARSKLSGDPVAWIAERGSATDCIDFVLPGRTVLKTQEPTVGTGPVILAWVIAAMVPPAPTLARSVPTHDVGASRARTLSSHRTTILL